MRMARKSINEAGFTIVELMVALSILSVVLLTTTIILIQIGALYSKGVNAANLQNSTRSVVSDIAGQLQFSGKMPHGCTLNVPPPDLAGTTCYANKEVFHAGGIDATVYSYCIGDTRYNYVLNHELGTDSSTGPPANFTARVLWRDTLDTDASTCPVADIVNGTNLDDPPSRGDGYEMLGNHMRLTRFRIQETATASGIYNVDVWTAFGDNDLVRPDPDPAAPPGRSICDGGQGTQFCATANISTQLTGRVY